VHVATAEVSVYLTPVPRPVAHLLGNRQALRVVLDGLRIVPLRTIRVAEVPVRDALPTLPPPGLPPPWPWYYGQVLLVVLSALEKFPRF
jgi:hypothetical protein